MEYNSPLGKEKERKLTSLLDLQPNNKVLEVGCGNGRFLLNLLDTYDINVLGVDIDSKLISIANDAAKSRSCEAKYQFTCQRFDELKIKSQYYDLFVCNGSSHAFGTQEAALPNMAQQAYELLGRGGRLLLGECYWKKAPPQAFLDFLGQPASIYRDYKSNIEVFEKYGFKPLYATSSNQDEWDDFEWRRSRTIHNQIKLDPNNEELLGKQSHIQQWLNAYLKWGRDYLGYGFYIFEKVES
ncbi:hypothetical protein N480_05585 [Pseudoalteromonas luteoviolacea S2607]|uniref:class I SAM-dependent methyltransferase n=1 Tax=Pseudoalteromonas luteoviolacea TaxID=43657 RepID=UPI0007B0AACC|nr:class I SAM-dependent methyltransferase [Pseudoalteromonas luteoviolacea]KZN30424.1 hypothetical protein N480_05585 [Pseudoalteromonas luteoviolacea S2607]